MINNNAKDFPPPKTRIVNQDGSFSTDGFNLIQSLWNRTGQAPGISEQVAPDLEALGSTQDDALLLQKDVSEVLTVDAGTGVILFSGLRPGLGQWIYNGGANSLKIYPPIDSEIDSLGLNIPYVLAIGKQQFIRSFSLGQLRSLQLG